MTALQWGAVVFLGGSLLVAALVSVYSDVTEWLEDRKEAGRYGKHAEKAGAS